MDYVPNHSHTEINKKYTIGFTFLSTGFFLIGLSNIATEFIGLASSIGLILFIIGALIVALANSNDLCHENFEENYIKDKNKNRVYKILINLNLVLSIIYFVVFIFLKIEDTKFYYYFIFIYLICLPIYLSYIKKENKFKQDFLKEIK